MIQFSINEFLLGLEVGIKFISLNFPKALYVCASGESWPGLPHILPKNSSRYQ